MKNHTILTALAVLAAALAHPAQAEFTRTKGEVTHLNGIPLPPIQTAAQARAETEKRLAAIKAAEAKVAAQASVHPPSAISNPQFFYTGKPYLEETGQYVFLFRHYDPELGRWTTADPSGFPDGANNVAYMAVPTTEFDWQGLKSVTIAQIIAESWTNTFEWLEAAGGAVATVAGLFTTPAVVGAAVTLGGAGVLVGQIGDWRGNGQLVTDVPGDVPDNYTLQSITRNPNWTYRIDTQAVSLTAVAITLTYTYTNDWNWSE